MDIDTEYKRGMFYPQPIPHLDMYRYQQLQSVTQVVVIDEVSGMQVVIFHQIKPTDHDKD